MSDIGNSNRISRAYLDSLLIETRYMDSAFPTLDFELYGTKAATPIMTAALSHLDHFMYPGAADALAKGAKEAGAILWYGMAEEEEIERLAGYGGPMIEIIKPYQDRDLISRKIRHAEKLGLLAVGIDIDHPFAGDGSADIVSGYELAPLGTDELREICRDTGLPVIIRGGKVPGCRGSGPCAVPPQQPDRIRASPTGPAAGDCGDDLRAGTGFCGLRDQNRNGCLQGAGTGREGRVHRASADDRDQTGSGERGPGLSGQDDRRAQKGHGVHGLHDAGKDGSHGNPQNLRGFPAFAGIQEGCRRFQLSG